MTAHSSYQPFLIGQGKSATGLFTYLDSWVKPEDAYDRLENAYVYKGNLTQRTGMVPYQSAAGNGALVYLDSLSIATGDGGVAYTYTFLKRPVIAGTVVVSALAAGTVRSMTDNGIGGFTGALNAGASSINYTTGALSINAAAAIGAGVQIWAQFGYVPTQITTGVKVYNPIMGIKQFTSPTTGQSITIVMDTKRASYYNQATKTFVGLNQFTQVIWEQFGALLTSGAINTQWTSIARYSVTVTDGVNTMVDDGAAATANFINTVGAGFSAGTSSIVYATGIVTVNYAGAPPIGRQVTITAKVVGDYFTGNNTNFFNATNWRYNDVEGDFLYMTNNVDPITLFNGTQLARPLFNTVLASVKTFSYTNLDTIKTTLDIKVYKNRLLFIRPTLLGTTIPEAQTVRYSQQQEARVVPTVIFSSYNFAADFSGNGGFTNCPTGDWLMSTQLIRDVLIIFATNSVWVFRFTQTAFEPYRFDQVNSTRATNAPYGSVPYDTQATSMGTKGLIYCDGVNVDRYDQAILDQFEEINQSGFSQCFAQKYDTMNQTWMLYPNENNLLLTNDKVLIYNYLENTWATFVPNMGTIANIPTNINALSCLGLGLNVKDVTWADFAAGSGSQVANKNWSQANFPWIGYATQTLSPVLLGGDQNGVVYQMYVGTTDNGSPIKTYVNTKRFNPFIGQQGVKARFGYLDVYYEVNSEISLSFNFYINNSEDAVKSSQIVLDGPQGAVWNWKRIYLNMVGEFVQIEINNEDPPGSISNFNTGGTFNILGMILHAAPAGRLTPGTFL